MQAGQPTSRRFALLLEDLLEASGTRAERAIGWVRILVCVLGLLHLLWFGGVAGLVAGELKAWLRTAAVVAGNVGTPERPQYTVLGDTVNIASRLESATKDQAYDVLVSADCLQGALRAAAGDRLPSFEPAGTIDIRGREAGLDVCRLRD